VSNGQALCVTCHKEAHRVGKSGEKYIKATVDIPELVAV
jgi:hypothetical protein